MTGDEVRLSEFHEAFRGYHVDDVDPVLEEVAVALDAGQPIGPLVEGAHFRRSLRGYRVGDVDSLLARLRQEVSAP